MRIIGLTGGAGMGKSTASAWLRRRHIPVFDADKTVHLLQRRGGEAAAQIDAAFPGVVRNGAVDRGLLREQVIGKPDALRRLEQILHPLVRKAEHAFIKACRRRQARLIILDIPLLFETGGDSLADHTITMSAPAPIQRHRLRLRGLDEAQITKLIGHQMTDRHRRRLADSVILTGLSRFHSARQLNAIIIEASGYRLRRRKKRKIV